MKRPLTSLIDDEGAVSPVIGVILMVAITVIIAAVLGTFLLGFANQASQSVPQAVVSVDDYEKNGPPENDTITLKHLGGDTLVASETNIKVKIVGSSFTFQAANATEVDFSPANLAVITLINTTNDSDFEHANITFHGEQVYTNKSVPTGLVLQVDDVVTITFVDDPSGQIIVEKTFTV